MRNGALLASVDEVAVAGPQPQPQRGVTELLAASPAAHRRGVAVALALRTGATAEEIGVALHDAERMAGLAAGLSADAWRLAARSVFFGEATVYESWTGHPSAAAAELERHGLVFAFREPYSGVEYHMPADLHAPLAAALASSRASGLEKARPARVIEAPLQLAHDVASLWAALARAPVRLKTDGAVYQREVPRLLAALPPVELHAFEDALTDVRLDLVLAILREEGLVNLRVDDRPGGEVRRELVTAANPAALLAEHPENLRARLLRHVDRESLAGVALALIASLEPGATVSLKSFGAAMRGLAEEAAGVGFDKRVSDFAIAFAGVHHPWLAGEVLLGVDQQGSPTALCLRRAAVPERSRAALVCQGNFELVALAPPTPAERLVLALTCEPVSGQAHVFRLTRESVRGAQRSGALPLGVVAALEEIVGELPQNVVASLLDWASSVRPPLRLRTAMVLDSGDGATAEALLAGQLAGHVVERLGPTQLAIRAADLAAVQAALKKAGYELDPGIDRVSGRWSEREPAADEAERRWRPDPGSPPPSGTQVSTLDSDAPTPAPVTLRLAVPAASAAPGEDDPLQVVLDAIEREGDVFIVYAGARGTTRRRITPYEVEGAEVHAFCHLRAEERSFWLGSIVGAVAASD